MAYYVTASQDAYPWFAYGELYRMEPEYRTNAFITDARGFVDYERPDRYTFEAVDDNDDQDRFPDGNACGKTVILLSASLLLV